MAGITVPRYIAPVTRISDRLCPICEESFELHRGHSLLHDITVYFCGRCGYVTSDIAELKKQVRA